MKKVTVLGGGTGTFVVLSGLKNDSLDLSVVVSMSDSGGSTGKLRDQLGVLPPGDLRQCLVALSDAPALWRRLFLYRFEKGDLKGHNFGNLFLAALEKVSTSYDEAIKTASYVLKTKGNVIPVTLDKVHLVAEYVNGKVVTGEGFIDENHFENSRIKKAYLSPEANANTKAIRAITSSNYIIIGPGDLYTSIIPVLLVKGVREAIQSSSAKVIFVMNLMTKAGQTTDYKASDSVSDLRKYLGRDPDVVLINKEMIPKDILKSYEQFHEVPIENDLDPDKVAYKIIEKDLIDSTVNNKSESDILYRSILRHDSQKVNEVLLKLFDNV